MSRQGRGLRGRTDGRAGKAIPPQSGMTACYILFSFLFEIYLALSFITKFYFVTNFIVLPLLFHRFVGLCISLSPKVSDR